MKTRIMLKIPALVILQVKVKQYKDHVCISDLTSQRCTIMNIFPLPFKPSRGNKLVICDSGLQLEKISCLTDVKKNMALYIVFAAVRCFLKMTSS